MKKILFITACLLPAAIMTQGQEKFIIKGKIGNLGTPAKAYLSYSGRTNLIIDSSEIVTGAFAFTGRLRGIVQGTLKIKHAINKGTVATNDEIVLYLEPTTIQITSTTDSLVHAEIKGSKLNEDDARYKMLIKPVRNRAAALAAEYRSQSTVKRGNNAYMETVYTRDDANKAEMKTLNKQFYSANPDSYVGLIAFQSNMDIENDLNNAEIDFIKFSAGVRATELGKVIGQMIQSAKKTSVGQYAMDFTQNDVNNKPVKLSNFRGKYVLLDFWASWCKPCRAENPNILKAFNAFKDKKFTVLSVSLDNSDKKQDWLHAIEKDGLVWTQLSDLKGLENTAAKEYGVSRIPANFLIDPFGKIIAKNVRGEELQKKLEEILDKSK